VLVIDDVLLVGAASLCALVDECCERLGACRG